MLQAQNDELSRDKADLLEMIDRKNKDLDSKSEEIRGLLDKAQQLTEGKVASDNQKADFEMKQVTDNFERSKLEREREQLTEQNQWLNSELEQKTASVLKLRQEKMAATVRA